MTKFWQLADSAPSAATLMRNRLAMLLASDPDFPLPFNMEPPTASELERYQASNSPPMPKVLRELYFELNGIEFGPDLIPPPIVFLYRPQDLTWLSGEELFGSIDSDWKSRSYLAFAQGCYGDWIVYLEDPPAGAGQVILVSHDGGDLADNRPTNASVLGTTLLSWLSRWAACDFNEYAYTPAVSDDRLPARQHRDFWEDHLSLNPKSEWALEKLAHPSDSP